MWAPCTFKNYGASGNNHHFFLVRVYHVKKNNSRNHREAPDYEGLTLLCWSDLRGGTSRWSIFWHGKWPWVCHTAGIYRYKAATKHAKQRGMPTVWFPSLATQSQCHWHRWIVIVIDIDSFPNVWHAMPARAISLQGKYYINHWTFSIWEGIESSKPRERVGPTKQSKTKNCPQPITAILTATTMTLPLTSAFCTNQDPNFQGMPR